MAGFKINTELIYDENNEKVKSWGYKTLTARKGVKGVWPIKLFKSHLVRGMENSENLESRLNEVTNFAKKAVVDYLSKMGL